MGRQTLLPGGQAGSALQESQEQPTEERTTLIQLSAPLTVKVGGQGLALDGPREFVALQTPDPDPKVGSFASCSRAQSLCFRMKSCQLQEMSKGWTGSLGLQRHKTSSNRNSLYSLQTCPAITAPKQPHVFKEEAVSIKAVPAPFPKLHQHLYFAQVGLDGAAAALQLESPCPAIPALWKQLC